MKEIKGHRLCVKLGASQVRRRLKGLGLGVRKVESAGRGEAVIIHTATGQRLRELRAIFHDVLERDTPEDSSPTLDEEEDTDRMTCVPPRRNQYYKDKEHGCRSLAVLLVILASIAAGQEPGRPPMPTVSPDRSVTERVKGRTFPSVFQAWSPAQNIRDESPLHTVARHDLIWQGPQFFGLRWNNSYTGLADGFTPESIRAARLFRQRLLKLNPNLVLIAEIRYRDAHRSYLPDGHEWWLRDRQGQIVPGWDEGSFLCLDFHNPQFRSQVAAQAKAVVESGAADGVMLDWWSDDASRRELIRTVRLAVGEQAIIIANANDRQTPQTAPFINGYFMECYRSQTAKDWKTIADTLVWAESHLREPRVNCLETWFHKSRDDLDLVRATTTLVLTHSDGYCLFSDPNPLPTPDHLHNWYPFWERSLGKPIAERQSRPDGTVSREFEHGTAVYNPLGSRPVTVTFSERRKSVATGRVDEEHALGCPDGDIFLRLK